MNNVTNHFRFRRLGFGFGESCGRGHIGAIPAVGRSGAPDPGVANFSWDLSRRISGEEAAFLLVSGTISGQCWGRINDNSEIEC